jgi:hypothetical protein
MTFLKKKKRKKNYMKPDTRGKSGEMNIKRHGKGLRSDRNVLYLLFVDIQQYTFLNKVNYSLKG